MLKRKSLLKLVIALTLCFAIHLLYSHPSITVDPVGHFISVDEEVVEESILLRNASDNDVEFSIRTRWIIERDGQQVGPRRDDPGDVIREFNLPYRENAGLAWDGELLWGTCRTGTRRLFAMDPEDNFRVVRDFVLQQSDAIGLMWEPLDGLLWVNEYVAPNNPSIAWRYDQDGELVDRLNMPRGAHWDWCTDESFVYGHSEHNQNQQRIYKMTRDGEVVAEGPDLRALINRGRAISIEYVRDHPGGNFWVMATGYIAQVDIDWENGRAEIISGFNSRNQDYPHQGITHDGENLIAGGNWAGQVGFVYDDGIEEVRVLSVEPIDGVIPANDEVNIQIIANPEGVEEGIYKHLLTFTFVEGEERYEVEMSVLVSVGEPVATVYGRVSDPARDNQPIEHIKVSVDGYAYHRFTDENGEYSLQNLPLGEYAIIFTADNYLPHTEHIILEEAGEYNLNVSLLHSQFVLSVDEIVTSMNPDMDAEFEIVLSNPGNGPLRFTSIKRLIGDADAEPWEARRSYPISAITEDAGIQGVAYVNEQFYVAGRNNNQMYVLNKEGELIRTFDQPGEARFGFYDLTWDGELLWGSNHRSVFGFTTDGELVSTWEGPVNPNTNIVWDEERGLFWISGTSSNIFAYDTEGNNVHSYGREGLRMYGFAIWKDDPDGYDLYILSNPEGDRHVVHKMNPDDGEIVFVTELTEQTAGRPLGAFITNQFDIYSWVMLSISNIGGDDELMVWQVDARKDWMEIEPTEGIVDAGDEMELTLTLSTMGLPIAQFNGEIVFTHDGVSGETILPITLDVAEGRVQTHRTLNFEMGWNLVSTNVLPNEDDVVELMQPLVDDDVLIMVKDYRGNFYRPDVGFSNIPFWNVAEGYQVRVSEAAQLRIEGESVLPDDPLDLDRGWQMISYYPRVPVVERIAFSGIVDVLEIVKDAWGNFYIPEWDFSNMAPIREGQGYQIKTTDAVELVWRLQRDDLAALRHNHRNVRNPSIEVARTSENMSVLILGADLSDYEIGVYADDRLVGAGVMVDGACGIAVWGDENLRGSSLRLVSITADLTRGLIADLADYESLVGEGIYEKDGLWVVRVGNEQQIEQIKQIALTDIHPNPFNSTTRLTYSVKESGNINLSLFDVQGRLVVTLVSGKVDVGTHSIVLDGSQLATGVYLARLTSSEGTSLKKLTLLK